MRRLMLVLLMLLSCGTSGFAVDAYTGFGVLTARVEEAAATLQIMDKAFRREFSGQEAWIPVMKAVVFPEVIRQSVLVDIMQLSLDKLILNEDAIFNFSIGPFQIKPSFALHWKARGEKLGVTLAGSIPGEPAKLAEYLGTVAGSLRVLHIFLDCHRAENPGLVSLNASDRTLILSTSYTFGIMASIAELRDLSDTPTWHAGNSISKTREPLPYSLVSSYYLRFFGR